MKRGKKIVSLLLTMMLFIQCSAISYAKEPDSLPQEAVYDLQKGGTQTFEIVESDGNKAIVTISEEKAISRIANGSYNVKYTSVGCWTAGFKVSIRFLHLLLKLFHRFRVGSGFISFGK